MKRIFVAIKIKPNETLTDIYFDLKNKLKRDKINWVDLKNLHITLKFFGETNEDDIPGICEHLDELMHFNRSFKLSLKGIGIFGSSYKPSVIWLGIEHNDSLIKLGTDVIDRMDNLGYKKDRQNFVPHLTLGRIKNIQDKKYFSELIGTYKNTFIQNTEVDQMHLIESKLSSAGPTYTVLESFDLA